MSEPAGDTAAIRSDLEALRFRIEELHRVDQEQHDGLRLRIEELEIRLETRIAAEEAKRDAEIRALNAKWNDIVMGLAASTRSIANLSSQVTASHYSLVHLLAVTARQVRVPDADLSEAMRIAKEAMEPPR